MKTLLTLLLMFISFISFGQDVKPTGLLPIQAPGFYYYQTDSSVWIYKGSTLGWTKLVSKKMLKQSIDSLSFIGYSIMYEQEVITSGTTTYTIPFKLRDKTMVYYNGILLRSTQWIGIGTTSLTIGVYPVEKDFIKIQN